MEKRGLIVLSLFDGLSCGRIALEELNIEVTKYIASEIKPFAIEQSKKNFPNTIQIGDVTKVFYDRRAKVLYSNCDRELIDALDNHEGKTSWSDKELASFKRKKFDVAANGEVYKWNFDKAIKIHEGSIDLLIGGSPCQQFSRANYFTNPKEKYGLKGDTSKLFFEYYRLLKQVKPKYFLLENVKMLEDSENYLNELMGVKAIHLNSNLLTIQNRDRLYWTNIWNVKAPSDTYENFQKYKIQTLPKFEELIRRKKFIDPSISLETNKSEEYYIWNRNLWAYKELKKIYPNMTKKEFVEEIHRQLYEATPKRVPFREKMWGYGTFRGEYVSKNITNAKKVGCLTCRLDKNPSTSGLILFGDFYRYPCKLELAKCQGVDLKYLKGLDYVKFQNLLGDSWTIPMIKHLFSPLKDRYKTKRPIDYSIGLLFGYKIF